MGAALLAAVDLASRYIIRYKGHESTLLEAFSLADNAMECFFLAPNLCVLEKCIEDLWIALLCSTVLASFGSSHIFP